MVRSQQPLGKLAQFIYYSPVLVIRCEVSQCKGPLPLGTPLLLTSCRPPQLSAARYLPAINIHTPTELAIILALDCPEERHTM